VREEKCSAKVTVNRSDCTRSVSRQMRGQRRFSANGLRSRKARALRAAIRASESQLSLSAGGQSEFERGGRPSAYVREIQGRCGGHRTYRQARRSLEGTTHGRPARQMQLRVAAFLRVTHTVASMNARTKTNGHGTVSTHARPTHMLFNQRPNPSIEGTSNSQLRCLSAAPHVKR